MYHLVYSINRSMGVSLEAMPEKISGCDMSSAFVSRVDSGARRKGGAVILLRSMPPRARLTKVRKDDLSDSGTEPVAIVFTST